MSMFERCKLGLLYAGVIAYASAVVIAMSYWLSAYSVGVS